MSGISLIIWRRACLGNGFGVCGACGCDESFSIPGDYAALHQSSSEYLKVFENKILVAGN
jgi:hypothetical protein